MYLLDTDVLIWILRGNTQLTQTVRALARKQTLAVSVVSVAEIYKNIFPSELSTVEEFLSAHQILDVDAKIAKNAGLYWQEYHKQVSGMGLIDCMIAATAKSHRATLFSLNTKHFPMQDIALYRIPTA